MMALWGGVLVLCDCIESLYPVQEMDDDRPNIDVNIVKPSRGTRTRKPLHTDVRSYLQQLN